MADPTTQPPEGEWHYEHITPDLLQAERVDKVIFTGRTAHQSVTIHDTACFGRTLVLDDKTQSTALDEFVYHEALVQPSMIAHPAPREVFLAGGGEGATAREILSHASVTRVLMADIDGEVVDLCKRYLPDHHRGAFDDPRLELHTVDALKFLEDSPQRFDVAIIDVPDPLEGGPAYLLYTREFYRLLRKRLRPHGMIVAQAGPTGPAFYKQCFSAVVSTMRAVFPSVFPYEAFVPSFGSTWGFVVGSLGPDPTTLSLEDVDRRIGERVGDALRYYDGITHGGMFSVPKYLRAAIAAEKRVITKASPLFVS